MRGDAAAVQLYRDTTFAWSAGDVDVRMPGAESGAEVYARYDAVIDEIVLSGVGTAAVRSSDTQDRQVRLQRHAVQPLRHHRAGSAVDRRL